MHILQILLLRGWLFAKFIIENFVNQSDMHFAVRHAPEKGAKSWADLTSECMAQPNYKTDSHRLTTRKHMWPKISSSKAGLIFKSIGHCTIHQYRPSIFVGLSS
jgi:hypothetical protein